jgi:hypothetical protein
VAELDELPETLSTGAAQACLAAFGGRRMLWPKAQPAYDAVSVRRAELTCMDLATLDLLGRVLAVHEDHRTVVFRRLRLRRADGGR